MQLKHQKGKLQLRKTLAEIIQEQCAQNGLLLLPIEPGAIYGLGQLPLHHADPFDRLIISQSKLYGYAVVTNDGEFGKYDLRLVWCGECFFIFVPSPRGTLICTNPP